MPFDLFIGDETTPIMFTDHVEDGLAVNTLCLRARTPLQVMSHAAASGELALTERTKNLRVTVDFRVQVLFMKFIRNQCCPRKWETHHFEVVLILELHATIWAVTLVMLLCLHMLLSTGDRMKLPTTGFTRYLGRPMTQRVHVLSCLSLTMKHLLA